MRRTICQCIRRSMVLNNTENNLYKIQIQVSYIAVTQYNLIFIRLCIFVWYRCNPLLWWTGADSSNDIYLRKVSTNLILKGSCLPWLIALCHIYIRLKIKPNSARIRFLSCQIFVLPSTGFELTPLMHCSTNRLALCPAP